MVKVRDAVVAGGVTVAALTGTACSDLGDTVGDIQGVCPAAPEGVRHGNVETFLASNPGFMTAEHVRSMDGVFKDGNNDSKQHITGGQGILVMLQEEIARIEEKMPVDEQALKAHQDAAAAVRVMDAMTQSPDNVFITVDTPCADRAQLHFASAGGSGQKPIEFSTPHLTYEGLKQLLADVAKHGTDEYSYSTTPLGVFAGIAARQVATLEPQKEVAWGADDPTVLSAVQRYAQGRGPQAQVSSTAGSATARLTGERAGAQWVRS